MKRAYIWFFLIWLCGYVCGAGLLSAGEVTVGGRAESESAFPVPEGFVRVPLPEFCEAAGVAEDGVLAGFLPVPESGKADDPQGTAPAREWFVLHKSSYAGEGGSFAGKDFAGLKQLLESGFFLEQTAEFLRSRYPDAASEVEVESLYGLPENAAGYVSVEPVFSVVVGDKQLLVRVVCEVLLDGRLLTVEYVLKGGERQAAVNRAQRYVRRLSGGSAPQRPDMPLDDLSLGNTLSSADYSGFSDFDFTLRYPLSWSTPEYAASRGRLLAIQPLRERPGVAVNIVLSTLVLPFSVGEDIGGAEEIIGQLFAPQRRESADYRMERGYVGAVAALVQSFDADSGSGEGALRSHRRIITLINEDKLLNISLNADYPASAVSGEDFAEYIRRLEELQQRIAGSVEFRE